MISPEMMELQLEIARLQIEKEYMMRIHQMELESARKESAQLRDEVVKLRVRNGKLQARLRCPRNISGCAVDSLDQVDEGYGSASEGYESGGEGHDFDEEEEEGKE